MWNPFSFVWRLVFPATCFRCGAYDTWWCEACQQTLPVVAESRCPVCLVPGNRHTDCPSALDRLFITGEYSEPVLARAIHALKYDFLTGLARPLATRLAGSVHAALTREPAETICVPIPTHTRRYRERGYNQAALLATSCALMLDCSVTERALQRTNPTKSQVGLNRDQRAVNLRDALVCSDHSLITGKRVLLIDDVTTTGTTLEYAAQALRMAEPREIWGAVVASDARLYRTGRFR